MLRLFLASAALALVRQSVGDETCPCDYRQADPLFPGEDGRRWDCVYKDHGLTSLPSSCFSQHSDVTQVFLDFNNISLLPIQGFAELSSLSTLSIRDNDLVAIDEGLFSGLRLLEYLDLRGNRLTVLPGDLWGLTRLTGLYLSANRLRDAQAFNMSRLVDLQVLDLHWNHLSRIPTRSLESLSDLRVLHLHWNVLEELPLLEGNPRLEEVLVNGNAILNFPKHVFGELSQPLTYHFVDNPAYDIWAPMLLPLPDRSHIVMGNDVSIWAEDEDQAQEILQKDWLVQDGLSQELDLRTLLRICGTSRPGVLLPPC